MLDAIELTKDNERMTVCIAFNYGGRAEILEAVRRIVADGVDPQGIDDDLFTSYLYTADIPDPDLIIRTAGEMRLSNFLLWQGAYAEFVLNPRLLAGLRHPRHRRRAAGLQPAEAALRRPPARRRRLSYAGQRQERRPPQRPAHPRPQNSQR